MSCFICEKEVPTNQDSVCSACKNTKKDSTKKDRPTKKTLISNFFVGLFFLPFLPVFLVCYSLVFLPILLVAELGKSIKSIFEK